MRGGDGVSAQFDAIDAEQTIEQRYRA